MRNQLPREELTKRTARFLTKAYKDAQLSRREAAERGDVTEGYLTGLLAGRASVPGMEILRAMSEGWGFNILDFFKTIGWINDRDIEKYISREKLMEDAAPSDVKVIYSKLMSMDAQKRRTVSQSVITTIDTFTEES